MSNARDESIILVVDDDPESRELLSDLLNKEGYLVVCAEDGRQALDYMSSSTPGLILLDLMMPKMSGWEFLAQQKNDPRLASIPVVVISGSGLTTAIEDCVVVHKPVDFALLKRMVEHYRLKGGTFA